MVRRLLKSLLKESAYPEPTENVSLIETHVSFIFLTDQFVYKVKKPVNFGFLDFTTLERRHFFCQEEVRLNRRLCPDIYLGVVELHETEAGASFRAGGRLIDYAVKMKRLPKERMLDHLLVSGTVEAATMASLARFVADFHAKAARGPEIDACGSLPAIRENWAENFRQAEPFVGQTIRACDLALIRCSVEQFLSGHGELFGERVRDGFIRECDGDLHPGNICLTDGICIFDCIEFNERFRYTDVCADVAFLLMDLEFSGHRELCRPFLEAYRQAGGDPGPSSLVNFYQGYRAFIRGKVHSFRLQEAGVPPEELARAKETAERYFRLARGCALRDRLSPTLILTCGAMGSGKSTLARELAFQLGLPLAQSDAVRKKLAGPAATRGSEQAYDQGIYAPSFNQATYDQLLKKAAAALRSGSGMVVDATFRRRGDRDRFQRLAREAGAGFAVLETACPPQLIKERLEKRGKDPHELSDGRWELFPRQLAEFEPTAAGESVHIDSALPLPEEVDQALRGMGILP
ncbi:AAA family ATPase [Geomonas sp.]|uniref:bifunctional aminoglycoside phosphotransferase/ATP-binding protein n=1 Tax=Geomonas sp. TaxID=2651584 RepID=UPI002B466F8B|nr:AAA family ATPase [Geomonas sp.]HJV35351.1 AAA family ATPase [Geomonas sp.]